MKKLIASALLILSASVLKAEITGLFTFPSGSNGDVQINDDGYFGGRTLTAGSNVTISTNSTQITISATGGGGGASSLEVFNNYYKVRSSPTASMSITGGLSMSVSGSTAIISAISNSTSIANGLGTAINVKAYGAVGDGATNDRTAILSALSAGSHIYFPPGNYFVAGSIVLDTNYDGYIIEGAGASETSSVGTRLTSNTTGPLFISSGSTSLNYLTLRNMALYHSGSTNGDLISISSSANFITLSNIVFSLSNSAARFLNANSTVFSFLNIENIRGYMATGSTVPAISVITNPYQSFASCLSDIMINSNDTATAPIIYMEQKSSTVGGYHKFERIICEVPDGGCIETRSLGNLVFENVNTADTITPSNPGIYIASSTAAGSLPTTDITFIGSVLTGGTTTYPDLKIQPVNGQNSIALINTRVSILQSTVAPIIQIGGSYGTNLVGDTRIMKLNHEGSGGLVLVPRDPIPYIQLKSTDSAQATCLGVDSDRLYADLNCDASKGGGEEYLDIAAGGGGGGGSLEVFSNFDATRTSPTASISLGDAMKMTVSGSTAIVTVDFSSVASRGSVILNQDTLQSGASYYVRMGLVDYRVGIGTNSPDVPLHVKDASDALVRLYRSGSFSAFNENEIEFYHNNGGGSLEKLGAIGFGSLSSNNAYFEDNAGTKNLTINGAQDYVSATAFETGGRIGVDEPRDITTSVSIDRNSYFHRVDATGGNITVTLPDIDSLTSPQITKHQYIFCKVDGSANTVDFAAGAGEDSAPTSSQLTFQNQCIMLISSYTVGSDAGQWYVAMKDSQGAGGGTPAGSDKNLQYNNGGAFGGIATVNYYSSTNTLTIGATTLVSADIFIGTNTAVLSGGNGPIQIVSANSNGDQVVTMNTDSTKTASYGSVNNNLIRLYTGVGGSARTDGSANNGVVLTRKQGSVDPAGLAIGHSNTSAPIMFYQNSSTVAAINTSSISFLNSGRNYVLDWGTSNGVSISTYVTVTGLIVSGGTSTLSGLYDASKTNGGKLTLNSSGKIVFDNDTSGGGGASALAVGTGTATNFTNNITSPTHAVSLLGGQFKSVANGTTNFISLDASSVTLGGVLVAGVGITLTPGSGQTLIESSGGIGSGSSIYPATATASFPFGFSVSTISFTGNRVFKADSYTAGAGICQDDSGCINGVKYQTSVTSTVYVSAVFEKSATTYWQLNASIPQNYSTSVSTVIAQIVWTSTGTSGDVSWYLDAKSVSDDDSLDSSFGSSIEIVDSNTASGDFLKTSEGIVTINNTPTGGDDLILRLYRAVGDSSDTWSGDARFLKVILYYPIDNISARD